MNCLAEITVCILKYLPDQNLFIAFKTTLMYPSSEKKKRNRFMYTISHIPIHIYIFSYIECVFLFKSVGLKTILIPWERQYKN